jgi:hypothetical protein
MLVWNKGDTVKLLSQARNHNLYQSTEGAEFVWVSECKKGAGCEIYNKPICFCIVPPMLSSVLIVVNWL